MRRQTSFFIAIPCLIGAAILALAQSPKAGLYEVTSKMTWQHSPFPAGMKDPRQSGAPHSAQVCFTQADLDKYSGPKPTANAGCEISNIKKRPSGMTAILTCGAPMHGKGTVETKWTDSAHSKSKVHFTGSMQIGADTKPIEWTLESSSTYKSPSCGTVKPRSD
jgi:hypothetical protein